MSADDSAANPASQPDFSAEKVARLARINVPANELAQWQSQLDRVLEFVAEIDHLSLDDVEPFFGTANQNHCRPDEVTSSTDRSQLLANAPQTDGKYYLVPPVMKPTASARNDETS